MHQYHHDQASNALHLYANDIVIYFKYSNITQTLEFLQAGFEVLQYNLNYKIGTEHKKIPNGHYIQIEKKKNHTQPFSNVHGVLIEMFGSLNTWVS